MSKLTLYDVAQEGMEIESILIDNEGELTPELEARMDALLREGPQRIEAAAMVVRGLEAAAEAAKQEAQRLRDRAASFDDNAQKLKARITVALDAAFGGRVKTPLFTVWAQSSPETVSFEIESGTDMESLLAVAPEMVRVSYSLDKKAAAEAYKSSELPNGILVNPNPGTRYCRIN